VAAVVRAVSVAAVAAGVWVSGGEAPGLSFGVTSLRDFGVSRGPSLDHLFCQGWFSFPTAHRETERKRRAHAHSSASVSSRLRASSFCSRSWTLKSSFFGALRMSGCLALALTFAGFARRPIRLSLPPTRSDRRQARRRHHRGQAARWNSTMPAVIYGSPSNDESADSLAEHKIAWLASPRERDLLPGPRTEDEVKRQRGGYERRTDRYRIERNPEGGHHEASLLAHDAACGLDGGLSSAAIPCKRS
jgi:hypothetical protein